MRVDLDPEDLRASISLWRDAADMKIALRDDLKVHFLSRRSELLDGFVKVASHWLIVLRACKAEGEHNEALQGLLRDVEAFKAWAENGIEELRRLGVQEAHADMLSELLRRPNPMDPSSKPDQ